MASVCADGISKCGYLTEMKGTLFGGQKHKAYYWKLKSQPTKLERYSNEHDTKPKERIDLANTKVEKHRSDNIICIDQQRGGPVRFLRADSREQRDEWCEAILMVICKLSGQDPEPRSRVYTDTTNDRRRPGLGRRTNGERQSTAPTVEESFADNSVPPRPLPAIPSAETEDDSISKIRQTPYCCIRKHIVGFNEKVYENVHYVRSEKEWVMEVESKKTTLTTQSDIYDDFSTLNTLRNNHQVQRPSSSPLSSSLSEVGEQEEEEEEDQDRGEPLYEYSIRPREPEENDERVSGRCRPAEDENAYETPRRERFPFNNLNKMQPQQSPNLLSLPLNVRPNSMESNEDNTENPELSHGQNSRPEPPIQNLRPEPPLRQKSRPVPPLPQKQRPKPLPRRKPPPELPQRPKPPPKPKQCQKPPPEPPKRQESRSKNELHEKLKTLNEEQKKLHGITKSIRKSSLVGNKMRLMEMNDGIWVIGWDPSETSLGQVFKVGDQLIKINKQALTSAKFAQDLICSTDDDEVTVVFKRVPYASVCTFKRRSPRDDLGFKLTGNEIVELDECGLVSKFGCLKPQTTGVSGHMCNWVITEVNMTPVDLFASEHSIFRTLRSGTLNELVLVVQPVDFIQMIRENLQKQL